MLRISSMNKTAFSILVNLACPVSDDKIDLQFDTDLSLVRIDIISGLVSQSAIKRAIIETKRDIENFMPVC